VGGHKGLGNSRSDVRPGASLEARNRLELLRRPLVLERYVVCRSAQSIFALPCMIQFLKNITPLCLSPPIPISPPPLTRGQTACQFWMGVAFLQASLLSNSVH